MEQRRGDDLPRAYRIGLRLRDLGADDDLIGDCLEIDPSAVSTLLEIGRQKLGTALHPRVDTAPRAPETVSSEGANSVPPTESPRR